LELVALVEILIALADLMETMEANQYWAQSQHEPGRKLPDLGEAELVVTEILEL
jgi:hypothetical protein